MAKSSVLGVYPDAPTAADAVDALRDAGFKRNDYEILAGSPYPEGTFGEEEAKHRLFYFPIIGAICGFTSAILITAGTQLAYPLVTGGKPILSIPPMLIICYEGTMLGAILFTVIGIIFESRLPRLGGVGVYDPRITEGYFGVVVAADPNRIGNAEQALQRANPIELIYPPSKTRQPVKAR